MRKIKLCKVLFQFQKPTQRGFTLIELLVVIMILGILAAVAGPNVHDAIVKNRVNSKATNFFTALLMARSEAVSRYAEVTVCPLSLTAAQFDSLLPTSTVTCSTGGFAQGWIVFENSGTASVLISDVIDIRHYSDVTTTYPINISAAGDMTYKPDGSFKALSGNIIKFCGPSSSSGANNQYFKEIVIHRYGSPSMTSQYGAC